MLRWSVSNSYANREKMEERKRNVIGGVVNETGGRREN